jgi:hypothetical protein
MRTYFTTSAGGTEMRRYSSPDAPSANSAVLHIWGPPPKRRPFAAALSWLMTSAIDGFAAYGDMICPYLIDLPDPHTDQQQPGTAAPSPLCRRPQPDEPSLPPAAPPPPARGGITVRLARWLAWLRLQPRPDHAPPASGHETPDDRTPRDSGPPPWHPDDIDRYLERYLDHGGW